MKKFLDYLYGSFVPGLRKSYILFRISCRRLSVRTLLQDFISVTSSIGFVVIPAFLIGLLFLVLPQGRDTLLLVVEKMSASDFWPLIGLIVAVIIWSLFSELGVRYSINISDNTGNNLTDERVEWRKFVQRMLAALFLLWPGIIVFTGFLWTMFTAEYFSKSERYFYFGICLIVFFILVVILCFLYFHKFGGSGPGKLKRTIFGRRALPPLEQAWLNKLYGIYNDYTYVLPKPTGFLPPYRKALETFSDKFAKATPVFLAGFPQDTTVLREMRVIPKEFKLLNPDKIKKGRGDQYKWVYCVPTSFYRGLQLQVKIMALCSLVFLISISLVPAEWPFFSFFGAPGLVCLAFACYTGIYSGLLFLDKALFRNWKVSIRFLLLILFLFTTIYNRDHPVRLFGQKRVRPQVEEHFGKWFAAYKKAMDTQYPRDTLKEYPVIFICAEGGAFRTGAYTAMFLTKMEEVLLKHDQPINFRNSIFAMSGVSGGSVGLGFYNAIAFRDQLPLTDTNSVKKTKEFFLYDSLSPLIGKMLYGEFLNMFIWWPITRFDRAAALEKSWEAAYSDFSGKKTNTYKEPFIQTDSGKVKPMLVINTTEIETGQQCWVSNLDAPCLRFNDKRDLLNNKISNTRYSTAINFSSRFPLFSPGAEIKYKRDYRLHYLDGGYVENTGSASMLEVLQMLTATPEFVKVKPIVISLLFSEEDKTPPNVHVFNEITEIFDAIYNTRDGRSKTARSQLAELVYGHNNGIMIDAALTQTQKNVPMNWVLSKQSINHIESDVKIKLVANGTILNTFFQKDLKYLKY